MHAFTQEVPLGRHGTEPTQAEPRRHSNATPEPAQERRASPRAGRDHRPADRCRPDHAGNQALAQTGLDRSAQTTLGDAMAHRLALIVASAAAACAVVLPAPATAHSDGPTPSASADPHAGHDGHSSTPDPHAGHETVPAQPDPHADHGGTTPESGHEEHGVVGGDGHEQLPDTVSPEVRNLVLSGFAGVNVAVVFGAWLVRRTRPGDPDPRKRDTRTIR